MCKICPDCLGLVQLGVEQSFEEIAAIDRLTDAVREGALLQAAATIGVEDARRLRKALKEGGDGTAK